VEGSEILETQYLNLGTKKLDGRFGGSDEY